MENIKRSKRVSSQVSAKLKLCHCVKYLHYLGNITSAGDFLEAVTKADHVVCHFFHRDFERCKLLDKHLSILARKYFDTRFIKVSAPVSAVQQTTRNECTSHGHMQGKLTDVMGVSLGALASNTAEGLNCLPY